ncbi:MAG: hypothetical protein PF569_01360 [Candidatus Woesearchaeota archaeon]|jgi:hypothetical protein|nr:hypothetical protein [Candidatus Woesearchaeota archaeon]
MVRFLLHQSEKIGWRDLIGYPLLLTLLTLLFSSKLENINAETYWGLCGTAGYILPMFKKVMKGDNLLKIAVKSVKGAKSMSDNFIDELDKKLDEEDNDNE